MMRAWLKILKHLFPVFVSPTDRKELLISYRREPDTLQFISRLIHDLEQSDFSEWLATRETSNPEATGTGP